LLKQFFSMTGRTNRADYFWHCYAVPLIVSFFMVIGFGIANLVGDVGRMVFSFVAFTSLVIVAWSDIALTVRRLHDIDRPGWHCVLVLVPVFNIYFVLQLLLQKGSDGTNQYGEDPLSSELDEADIVSSAATRLELEGEWEKAIQLYTDLCQRWPEEHGEYAQNCIRRVQDKMTLAGIISP